MKRKQSQVFLETNVAQKIVPVEIKPGISLSTITGTLNVKDNVRNIQVYVKDLKLQKSKMLCSRNFLKIKLIEMLNMNGEP